MENRLITIEGKRYLAIPIPEKKPIKEPDEDLVVEGRIRRNDFKFTRGEVVSILEKEGSRFKDYKTTYLLWKNSKFALKSLFEALTQIPTRKYNTVQLEKYFEALGFEVYKMK